MIDFTFCSVKVIFKTVFRNVYIYVNTMSIASHFTLPNYLTWSWWKSTSKSDENEIYEWMSSIYLHNVQHYIDISCRGRGAGEGARGGIIIKTWHITTFIFPLTLKLWDDMIVFFQIYSRACSQIVLELLCQLHWELFWHCAIK